MLMFSLLTTLLPLTTHLPPTAHLLQTRPDAEKALNAMDGIVLHDNELRIGWGKSIPLPAVPCWPPPASGVVLQHTVIGYSKVVVQPVVKAAAIAPPGASAAAMAMHASRNDDDNPHKVWQLVRI